MNETKVDRHDRPGGVRPIRKRGYHRAIKRGEPWALMDYQMKKCMKSLSESIYQDLFKDNPLLNLIKKEREK